MLFLFGIALFVFICFAGVVFFGAPYVPTLTPQVETALKLLDLKPGQTLIEIGSGDGKVLLAAAKQGIRAYGYEINPLLVIVSLWRTRQYRALVRVEWGDAWSKTWPEPDGIFIFGLHRLIEKLHKKVMQNYTSPVRIVSIGFGLHDVPPTKEENGVFLYIAHK